MRDRIEPWRCRPIRSGFDAETPKARNAVERCISRLKQWRGLAVRTDRPADAYQAHALRLAAGLIRLRRGPKRRVLVQAEAKRRG